MKLLLLHGPGIEASRKNLHEIKTKFDIDNTVVFDSQVRSAEVTANLLTVPLFLTDRLIIWENPTEILKVSQNHSSSTTFVVWFDHEIDTKKWPDFEQRFFPEAKEISVFPLLDLLAVGDIKAFLEVEKLKAAGFDISYILTMVFYLLRNLVAVPPKAPDFVKKKLARQKMKFDIKKITSLYENILEIDFKIKAGILEKSQAEFFLINRFIGQFQL